MSATTQNNSPPEPPLSLIEEIRKIKWDDRVKHPIAKLSFISFAGENRDLATTLSHSVGSLYSPPVLVGKEIFLDSKSIFPGCKISPFVYFQAAKHCSAIMLVDEHFIRKKAPLREMACFEIAKVPRLYVLMQKKEYLMASYERYRKENPENYWEENHERFKSILSPGVYTSDDIRVDVYEALDLTKGDSGRLLEIGTRIIQMLSNNIRILLEQMSKEVQLEFTQISVTAKVNNWMVLRKRLARTRAPTEVRSLADRIDDKIKEEGFDDSLLEQEAQLKEIKSAVREPLVKMLGEELSGMLSNSKPEYVEMLNTLYAKLSNDEKQQLMSLWKKHMASQKELAVCTLKANHYRELLFGKFLCSGELNVLNDLPFLKGLEPETEVLTTNDIATVLITYLTESDEVNALGASLVHEVGSRFGDRVQAKLYNALEATEYIDSQSQLDSFNTQTIVSIVLLDRAIYTDSSNLVPLLELMEATGVSSYPIFMVEPYDVHDESKHSATFNSFNKRKGVVSIKFDEQPELLAHCMDLIEEAIVLNLMNKLSNDETILQRLSDPTFDTTKEGVKQLLSLWKQVETKSHSLGSKEPLIDRLGIHASVLEQVGMLCWKLYSDLQDKCDQMIHGMYARCINSKNRGIIVTKDPNNPNVIVADLEALKAIHEEEKQAALLIQQLNTIKAHLNVLMDLFYRLSTPEPDKSDDQLVGISL